MTEASGFIQGKVAGVTVQQTSGLPGSGMTVRVRGASSIASSNDPLYVVDGVPVGTGNYAIAYLSPQDIESMQILKEQTKPKIAFDFKAAAQRISTPTTTVSHSSNVVKSEQRKRQAGIQHPAPGGREKGRVEGSLQPDRFAVPELCGLL